MKKIIAFTLITFSVFVAIAKKNDYKQISLINKTEFNKHLRVIDLIIKTQNGYQRKGVIKIKTAGKTIILKDDGEFKQYVYEGELKGSQLIVIHELEPNTEEYYLINKQTGKIDTLIDKPIFYPNKQDFICLEGGGTDVNQRIQIGRIENSRLVNRRYIKNLPKELNPGFIYWFDKNTLYIDDNGQKFYKLTF